MQKVFSFVFHISKLLLFFQSQQAEMIDSKCPDRKSALAHT